jgi:hypothetical protein
LPYPDRFTAHFTVQGIHVLIKGLAQPRCLVIVELGQRINRFAGVTGLQSGVLAVRHQVLFFSLFAGSQDRAARGIDSLRAFGFPVTYHHFNVA